MARDHSNWKTPACEAGTADCLLGKKIYFVPFLPIELTFPYPCAAGILGSSSAVDQTSPVCASTCPSGQYCPSEVTTNATVCPAGSYCEAGSATPINCAAGTFGSAAGLKSASECSDCPAGSSCGAGSIAACIH